MREEKSSITIIIRAFFNYFFLRFGFFLVAGVGGLFPHQPMCATAIRLLFVAANKPRDGLRQGSPCFVESLAVSSVATIRVGDVGDEKGFFYTNCFF